MASLPAICRLRNPSSELFIAEHCYRSTRLGYEVSEGNRNNVKTWREIVTTMEARYGKAGGLGDEPRHIFDEQRSSSTACP